MALARLDPEPAPALGETGEKKPTDNGWFLGKWWRNTELNPRPISEQKSVRKSAVPILNHLAVSVDIGRIGWTGWLASFDVVTGSQSPSETPDRMAIIAGNAVALT